MRVHKLLAIARVTFFEIVRDKILYNTLLVAAVLLALGFLASRLSFVSTNRIVLDLGLTGVEISSAAVAVLVGAVILGREIDKRTIHLALSRPLSQAEFLCGKYLGLVWVLCVNWILLTVAYLLVMKATGSPANSTLFLALLLVLLQSFLIAGFAFFFSSFSTASLSVIFTVGILLIGKNISQIRFLSAKVDEQWLASILKALAALLPNFEHFGLGLNVTYGLPVPASVLVGSVIYGLLGIGLCMLVTVFAFAKKEI